MNCWAGGKIDDFTLEVCANNAAKHFFINEEIFPGEEFEVVEGVGKIQHGARVEEESDKCYEVSLQKGAIRLNVIDFCPKKELTIWAKEVIE